MATLTCKLPRKLDTELEASARAEGVTKSEFVREAIRDRVARARRGKKAPRAYDLVKDLSGILNGPGDLLTNPKYMEDFGR